MRDFGCPACGQHLTFDSSRCLSCGNKVGFGLFITAFVLAHDDNIAVVDQGRPNLCANQVIAGCNWLAASTAPTSLCASCALTRTRPADGDLEALVEFVVAEEAKRRLVMELVELGLPIRSRQIDPLHGLAFDLLSGEHHNVTTGHADGVITLDLSEGDDAHREQLRVSMAEPYRTLLGHFRHEIGHFYFDVLVRTPTERATFRELFGDPGADYQAALDRHYTEGPPPHWRDTYISAYASMHPAEDWAETFAHYLHIRDTLDTAAAFGFAPAGATLTNSLPGSVGFGRIIDLWLPLSWSLNMINRSMGHPDLYPFVLAPSALDKMRMVHRLVTAERHAGTAFSTWVDGAGPGAGDLSGSGRQSCDPERS